MYVGGKEETNGAYRVNGEIVHPRSLHHRYGTGGQSIPWLRANVDPKAERIKTPVKHKYLMPLDAEMRTRIAPLAKPYPKRESSAESGTPVPTGGGVANRPTRSNLTPGESPANEAE